MPGGLLLLFGVLIGVQSSPGQAGLRTYPYHIQDVNRPVTKPTTKHSAHQPPKLTLCKEEDSVCLTKTANVVFKLTVQGSPELHIEPLDPMFLKEIHGDLTGSKYKLSNNTIKGGKNCEVVNMKLELQKSKLYLAFNCPLMTMHGLYDVSGQILSIPVTGNGEYRVQCKDYYIQIDTDIKVSQRKDGKKYISLKSYQINSELKGGMVTHMTNLFNGKKKELAKSVLEFMNKHWRLVAKELQAPVFHSNLKKLIVSFNKYLKSVPLDQILVNF